MTHWLVTLICSTPPLLQDIFQAKIYCRWGVVVLDGLFSRSLCLHPAEYLLALKRLERRDDDYCEGSVSLHEAHLIMMDNPSDVLSVCKYFI